MPSAECGTPLKAPPADELELVVLVLATLGEIPVVQTLMMFGLGVGPAAALLTTLPAVSFPSLAMLAKAVPVRVLAVVAGAVTGLGLLSAVVAVALGF